MELKDQVDQSHQKSQKWGHQKIIKFNTKKKHKKLINKSDNS